MTVSLEALLTAATKLHAYLIREHWIGQSLEGPDVGIRFNARFGRFIKSYLPWVPWKDDLYYLQAQGYWIMDNWLLADITGDEHYVDIALACSEGVLQAQRPAGYWDYPNPEWRGRVATVEGCFGALGLLETFGCTRQEAFLAGALKWYHYMLEQVGFQRDGSGWAVNYFSNVPGSRVPNNTTLALWTLARLHQVTDNDAYLESCGPMVNWLNAVQMDTGELPYAVASNSGPCRPHFLCYQYNAFEFMDLARYAHITEDEAIRPVLSRLAPYLARGILPGGAAAYDCAHNKPEVAYYGAALAAALSQATLMGLGDYRDLSDRAFLRVLTQQRSDGGQAFHSQGSYGILADRRSYPRYLAMILHHLLLEVQTRVGWPTTQTQRALVVIQDHLEDQA
ncbi:MAG: hypothetical protein ACYC5M_14215 [Anaerolineae bacterium]